MSESVLLTPRAPACSSYTPGRGRFTGGFSVLTSMRSYTLASAHHTDTLQGFAQLCSHTGVNLSSVARHSRYIRVVLRSMPRHFDFPQWNPAGTQKLQRLLDSLELTQASRKQAHDWGVGEHAEMHQSMTVSATFALPSVAVV